MLRASKIIQKCQERTLRVPPSAPAGTKTPEEPARGFRSPQPLRPARTVHTGHALYDQLMKSHDRVSSRRTRP